jgi:hypothetical protein
MAVLLDDFEKANEILDGKGSTASKFGTIRYYEDNDITKWEPQITISDILGMHNEQTKFLKKTLEAVMYLYEEDSKKKK